MSEFLGQEYNYETFRRPSGKSSPMELLKTVVRAGEPAPDFTLPSLDGDEVTLSALRGAPVVIEFGSIT